VQSTLRASIYREIREEFRGRWADFYAAQHEGGDPDRLAALKAELVADQKALLDARRDEACAELRESRDERYRELLDRQRGIRADLRTRQEAGLDNGTFLQQMRDGDAGMGMTAAFQDGADEATNPGRKDASEVGRGADDAEPDSDDVKGAPRHANDGMRLRVFPAGAVVGNLLNIVINFGESPEPRPKQNTKNIFTAAAEQAKQHEKEAADEDWRKRQRSPCGE
jgi:hypothetical protein